VERVCPLGTRIIRRARVGWDAECERRSGLPLDVTKVFDHTAEQPLDVARALHRQCSHLACFIAVLGSLGYGCGPEHADNAVVCSFGGAKNAVGVHVYGVGE
jgi:hypothetical protein